MKVIVTGAKGFLGKKIFNKLKKKGHTILSYDIVDGQDILNNQQLEKTIIDFCPNTIIHLAACADLNIFAKKPDISYKINVIGTKNILNLCQKYNVRLLFASTCCCYVIIINIHQMKPHLLILQKNTQNQKKKVK